MKRLILPLMVLLFVARAGAQITAITEEGKAVLLFSNGTWRYLSDSVRISYADVHRYSVPTASTQVLQGTDTCYKIWYNPKEWRLLPDTLYRNADFSLENHDGEVIAMIISEKIQLPLQKIKAAAIESFTKTGTEFKITEEQRIVVNDTEGLLLKIDALVDDIPFSYLNTYFSTGTGTFQLITFTGYNLFDRYRNTMTELISGFVIHEP